MKVFFFFVMISVFFQPVLSAGDKKPSNIFRTTLDNGLEVLVLEDNNVPLATLELCVKNGAYTESAEYDGLSHLYEHMFFKANKKYPNQEAFMDKIQEMGAVFNGTTSEERVNYFITVTNNKVEEGLDFLYTAMRYPLFKEEEMHKENPVVDAEFQRAESTPVFFLLNEMDHHLWGDLYSRKNVIGDHDIIISATPEKMKIIKEKYYVPNNTILAVSGDVNHKEIFALADSIYSGWEPSNINPHEKYPIPEFKPMKYSSQFVTLNENAQVPILLFSYHGPDTRNDIKATYAADVFSFILSQNASKFHQEMVESGLTQAISVGYQTLKHVGPINIFIVLKDPQKLNEVLTKLNEHISRWDDDDYFTDEQLTTAKDLLAISEAYNSEKSSTYIHTLTYWWASADIEYYLNYINNLQKVTKDDIKRFTRKYIINKPYVSGMLINPGSAKEFLTDTVFTTVQTPEELKLPFEENSATIHEKGMAAILALTQWMKINPDIDLTIHVKSDFSEIKKIKIIPADIRYYHDKNGISKRETLENARFISIQSVLNRYGIDPKRTRGKFNRGFGENESEQSLNRITTFSIIK